MTFFSVDYGCKAGDASAICRISPEGVFSGIDVRTSPFLAKQNLIRRTWRERLYMRPFWPFGSVKWRVEVVPDENAYEMNIDGRKILIMHPLKLAQIKQALRQPPKEQE